MIVESWLVAGGDGVLERPDHRRPTLGDGSLFRDGEILRSISDKGNQHRRRVRNFLLRLGSKRRRRQEGSVRGVGGFCGLGCEAPLELLEPL